MKTLDEVIKALENVALADSDGESEGYFLAVDSLHYLKEFKRISARLEKIALGNITETLEKLDNPALTWEELKTMEGKPVWIEFINEEGERHDERCLVESSNNLICEILRCQKTWWGLRKITLGKTWKAYRKERE